ncbi:MAG: SRPBCC family protein [Gemmatimonadetes bacterium]|nr:SRPBCC family protein [Gemmatimonadota bacterium]
MRIFSFESSQIIARPLAEVFAFFADAENLEAITPPWLRFRVTTRVPIEMKKGTIIGYRLRVHGVPIRWRSEITAWDPPHRFVDEQRKGPYRRWVHTHAFTSTDDDRTRVEDHVEYAVPGGRLVERWFVRPDIVRIFDYRSSALERLLGDAGS